VQEEEDGAKAVLEREPVQHWPTIEDKKDVLPEEQELIVARHRYKMCVTKAMLEEAIKT
jgi:hypothetical protein